MLANVGERISRLGHEAADATTDCVHECIRATDQMIRRQPTKALIVAASFGALVELAIFAFQHRPRPAAPSRWQSVVEKLRPRKRSVWQRLWT